MSMLRRIAQSQLVRGSLLVFIASNIANFGNFIYNLSMARLLGPEKYGELGALLSLFIFIGIPFGILNLLIIKTVSSYWGKREKNVIFSFLIYLRSRLFVVGIIVSIILILGTPFISAFLELDSYLPILIVAFSYVISGPALVNRAVLQGVLSFSSITINSFAETFLKLIVSIILVLLNFGLVGAILGTLTGGTIVYLLTLIELRIVLKYARVVKTNFSLSGLFKGFIPIFLTYAILTIFFNVDIILVRHFFPTKSSGEYIALSTIGKIIYYIIGPVITVMFPAISSRISSGTSYILPLLGTLVLSLGLSIILISIYFLFPKLIVSILFGDKYFGVIPYLGLFSFFITIYTVNSILTHFILSISYYRPIYPLFLISLLQGVSIFIYHSSIMQVIWINIIISLIYFIIILCFIWQKEKKVFGSVILKRLPTNIIYDS